MTTAFPGALDSYLAASNGVTVVDASDRNNVQDAIVALQKNAQVVVNVKTFQAAGAKGDGSTDDTTAIQAALDACRSAGGGIVYFPQGTYMLSMATRTGGFAGNACALMYGANTTILGAGAGATSLKLRNSQQGTTGLGSNNAAIFSPYNVSQEQVTFADFTVDGNGGNQSDQHHGIYVWRQRGVRLFRVRAMNCRGTANTGGATETFCFYISGSTDVTHVACEAIQTAGTVANGYVANGSQSVVYQGCRAVAIGTAASFGFGFNVGTTSASSRQIVYQGCHAYLCGTQGFHIDSANVADVIYDGCFSGGVASDIVSGQQYPYTQSQSLGNQYGFVCTVAADRILYTGCVAESNSASGWELRAGTFQLVNCASSLNTSHGFSFNTSPTAIRANGLEAISNGGVGIRFGAVADANVSRIQNVRLNGNTTAAIQVNATNYAAAPANVAAPAVPATTVALTNPFGFDARVCVTPGASTCAVTLDGVATGVTLASSGVGQQFMVPGTGTIALAFTSTPSWTWYLL